MKAQVIRSTGSWYWAKSTDNQTFKCRLRGVFKNEGMKLTNPIAVGDWVNIEIEDDQNASYVIDEILERENYVIRKSSRNHHNTHIIASNIDQALLFCSLRSPNTSLGFIDRFLVSIEAYRIPGLIFFNKSDLYRDKDWEKFEMLKTYYNNIGYPTCICSVEKNEGLDELKSLILNKTTLISGHSGVGKSSVINALNPEFDLRTGGISKFSDKGTHTTTYAEMLEIFPNTKIIDTPGIKEMALADISKYELKDQYPEMRKYMNQCKFDDCMHIDEPQCKVREAIENGEIADWRYISYLSMLGDL